jgi:hypothetical protein
MIAGRKAGLTGESRLGIIVQPSFFYFFSFISSADPLLRVQVFWEIELAACETSAFGSLILVKEPL